MINTKERLLEILQENYDRLLYKDSSFAPSYKHMMVAIDKIDNDDEDLQFALKYDLAYSICDLILDCYTLEELDSKLFEMDLNIFKGLSKSDYILESDYTIEEWDKLINDCDYLIYGKGIIIVSW